MTDRPTRRAFTGWHMTAILIGFFAVVMTVNFVMAHFAMSTFGGKVVENSYVASQRYNEWLARADAQDRLGWVRTVTVDRDRHVRLIFYKEGKSLEGLDVIATLSHPLGRTPPRAMRFAGMTDGTLRSAEALPRGRWRLDLRVRHAADEARYRVDLR